MKLPLQKVLLSAVMLLSGLSLASAQCTRYESILYDSFEYTTVCPDLVPGMVIHNTPQTFGVRTGTYALYLNMVNCTGSTGTCPGDSVYIRTISCCPSQPIRFRWWMETVFAGTLSDIRVVLTDGNDSILADVPSTVAPYGSWTQFTSPAVIPGTFVVKLKIYTNVGGQNGNDLGIDDMYVERCATHSSTAVTACNTTPSLDLFSKLPATQVTTGTWSGPSALGNGYLGTYTSGTNTPGAYVYYSTPYGVGGNCLPVNDTLVVSTGVAPQPSLGNDTTICTNHAYLLNPGTSGPGLSYQWSNFATSATVTAYSGAVTQTTYAVTVSSTNGCVGRDSVRITFQTCSGIDEMDRSSEVSVYPNPAQNFISIKLPEDILTDCTLLILSADGKQVMQSEINQHTGKIALPTVSNGVYIYSLSNQKDFIARGKLTIRN